MSKDLQGCITAHGIKTHNKLPEAVKQAAAEGKRDEAIAAMQAYLSQLQNIKANIETQKDAFIENAASKISAASYVNRGDKDPTNELNNFVVKSFHKVWKNLVQRFGSMTAVLNSDFYHSPKNEISIPEHAVLVHFSKEGGLNRKLGLAIEAIFDPKGKREGKKSGFPFRYEDMIQYLPLRVQATFGEHQDLDLDPTIKSKLDAPTRAAMASVAYEWLATNGRKSMSQTSQTIHKFLGLKKGQSLPKNAMTLLAHMGSDAKTIAQQMGKVIVQRMGIEAGPQADAMAQERLELSMGYMTLAAMEHAGLIERQEVITNRTLDAWADTDPKADKRPIGVEAIKAGYDLDHKDIFYEDGDRPDGLKGLLHFTAIRVVDLDTLEEVETNFRTGREAFDKLFANEPQELGIRWKPFAKRVLNIGRSKVKAGKIRQANVDKYSNIPYVRDHGSIEFLKAAYNLIDPNIPEGEPNPIKQLFYEMLGAPNPDDLLTIHVKNNEGVIAGLEREFKAVLAFEDAHTDRIAQGESEEFYNPSVFMSSMRMLMQGDINPQNSKLHRNLFAPSSFRVSWNKGMDAQLDEAFLEAIAVAFDIEQGKKSIGDTKAQIAKLKNMLKINKDLPLDDKANVKAVAINKAIKAIQEYNITESMTVELMTDITAGVVAIDNKVTGMKGLFEYARYAGLKKGESFTTDQHNEIDGVSNGIIIATLQLIPDSADKQAVLATLAMGGISTKNKLESLNKLLIQHNLYDAYKRMGDAWAIRTGEMKEDLSKNKNKGDDLKLRKANALGWILGKFNDDKGLLTSTIRSLSKPRTMQIVYGAGLPGQIDLFTGEDVIHGGIYKKIEEIIGKVRREEHVSAEEDLKELLLNVKELTRIPTDITRYMDNGELDIVKLKDFKFTPEQEAEINKAVADTYGKAMKKAVKDVFGPIMEARVPFNNAVQLGVTTYNTILRKKIENLIASRPPGSKNPDTVTKEELQKILDSIEHLIPKIKTMRHTDSNPSYQPMAKVGKNRSYNKQAKVEQSYKEGAVKAYSGYAEGIPYLVMSGVGPMIKAIHMTDSEVANGLMAGDIQFLNNHDGFSHSLKDGQALADETNRIFMEVMSNYSIGQAFAEMSDQLASDARIIMAELGLDPKELFYGKKDETGKEVGGLLGDKVIGADLLQQLDLFTKEEKDARIGDMTERGMEWSDAVAAFVDQVIKETLDSGKYTVESLTQAIIDQTQLNANRMGEQTTRNKKVVTDSVWHWGQYPFRGVGVSVTNPANQTGQMVFENVDKSEDIQDATKVKENDQVRNDEKIEARRIQYKEGFSSIDANTVSTNPNDYQQGVKHIDAMNVTEVFEATVDLDNQAPYAAVQNSPEHIQYLKGILNSIVSKVMDPVKLYMDKHKITNETQGLWTIGDSGKTIWIQTQDLSSQPVPGMLTQGIRMSAAEVYAHELVHHVTHYGLRNAPVLEQQAYALMEIAFQEFTKQYGANAFRVFMNDPNADLNDPANAFEIMAAKDRWNYVFNQSSKANGKTNRLDEFVAFGMTNENFRRELGKLKIKLVPKGLSTIFEKNLQTTIENLYRMVMNFVYKTFSEQGQAGSVDKQLEILVRSLSRVDGKNKNVLTQTLSNAEEALTAFSIEIDEKIKEKVTEKWSNHKIGQVITKVKKIPNLDNMIGYHTRRVLRWYNDGEAGLIASLVTEMQQTTERLRPLHDLLRRRNHVLDATKQDVAATMRSVVNSWFTRQPSSYEKTAVTKALLKTDMSVFLDHISKDAMVGILTDARQREAKIQELLLKLENDPDLKEISDLMKETNPKDDLITYFMNAADDLGYFMVVGAEQTEKSVTMFNAHNIVSMPKSDYTNMIQGKARVKAELIVDQLATLASLRYANQSHKNAAANLITENYSAIENVLKHHIALKNDALAGTFNGNPVLLTKGYTKEMLNPRTKYIQGTLADKQKYEDLGYIMQATPIARDSQDPVQEAIYLFKSGTGTVNDFQPGIVSVTQNIARGATSYDIQQQIDQDSMTMRMLHLSMTTSQIANENNKIVLNHLNYKMKNMYLPRVQSAEPRGHENYMIPQFDWTGEIVKMRYMMTEHTKDTVLEQHSEFDAVLAAMTSQIVDKSVTPKINQEVVTALKDLYDHKDWGFKKMPDMFVEISPWSVNKKYRDIYHQLPPRMKQQIKTEWGEDRMWVPQDVIDLAFGQRKYSLSETFAKNPKDRNLFEKIMVNGLTFALGANNPFVDPPPDSIIPNSRQGNAVRRATVIYNTMAQIAKYGKSNIVVRNLSVIWGNHESNVMFLKSMGIPLGTILKLNKEASLGALAYQRDKHELESWLVKRRVIVDKQSLSQAEREIQIRNLDRRVVELKNRIANNPVTALIADGLMPSIVDDVETAHIQSPHRYGVDLLLDNALERLPGPLQKAGRTLFMTQDTEGFKMLNNAVKLTDFTGRYVLYHHLRSKGMSHELAVSDVMEKFINFDLPTHRMIGAANEVGLILFSKYRLRVLKHIKNVLLDRPFTTLATFVLSSSLRMGNILESIPGITSSFDQSLSNPLGLLVPSMDQILYVDGVQYIGETLGNVITPE